MDETGKTAFTVTRVGANGQVTIPTEYRDAEHLHPGTRLVMVQIGDALVLAPIDEDLAAVTGRMESAMKAAGQSIEQLIAAASAARAQIVDAEFDRKGDR